MAKKAAKKTASRSPKSSTPKPRNRAAQDTTLINHRATQRRLDLIEARLTNIEHRQTENEKTTGRLDKADRSRSRGNLVDKTAAPLAPGEGPLDHIGDEVDQPAARVPKHPEGRVAKPAALQGGPSTTAADRMPADKPLIEKAKEHESNG